MPLKLNSNDFDSFAMTILSDFTYSYKSHNRTLASNMSFASDSLKDLKIRTGQKQHYPSKPFPSKCKYHSAQCRSHVGNGIDLTHMTSTDIQDIDC